MCKIQNSLDRTIAGTDEIAFTDLLIKKFDLRQKQLQGTKYAMSTKSTRIKKDLPKKAIIDERMKNKLQRKSDAENLQLCLSLYRKSELKTLRENFRGHSIKRIWIPKPELRS